MTTSLWRSVTKEGPSAAGADVDSTGERMSSWYQRTDEDGRPVDYDYARDSYVDPEPPARR